MVLSPLEIQKKEFTKSLRGYNQEEVDEFLEILSQNYENTYKENKDLKERIRILEEKIKNYKEIETTLKNSLVLAEKTAEEVRKNAQKERETILNQARLQAKSIINKANEKYLRINNQNEELRGQFLLYKIRFKNFLQSQLDFLDSCELNIFDEEESLGSSDSAEKTAAATMDEVDFIQKSNVAVTEGEIEGLEEQ